MPRQVCLWPPAPTVHSHCALSYSSHTRRNKSCCHVTPASPAPYTEIVTDHGKGNGNCPHQFHSLLAPYMVMVDRPLRERLSKCPVSQSRSVYSLNQPGCRSSLVADTRRVGVRIQVITQHWLSCCFTSTEAGWPIRDRDRVGRGQGDWLDRGNRPKKTGETVDRRQNNGSVKAVSPRHCPATCALCNCSFNCCAGQSH